MITFSLCILNGLRLYNGGYHWIPCLVFQEKWSIKVFIELSILGLTTEFQKVGILGSRIPDIILEISGHSGLKQEI